MIGTKNIPPFVSAPISAGLCSYKDIYTLTLKDFKIMNEILTVRHYNQLSAERYYDQKMEN